MGVAISPDQEQELQSAGIGPDTVMRKKYEVYRVDGKLSHDDALSAVISERMKSDTLSNDELNRLKNYMKRIKGQFFDE